MPVCGIIHDILGPGSSKCISVTDSWTRPPVLSERFASTPSYQYYFPPTIRQRTSEIFLKEVCSGQSSSLGDCSPLLEELKYADYIDVDFDAISHAVTLTAFWSADSAIDAPSIAQRRQRTIKKLKVDDRIEVGVLTPETSKEPEQLSLGGYLTVIGENDHPGIRFLSRY